MVLAPVWFWIVRRVGRREQEKQPACQRAAVALAAGSPALQDSHKSGVLSSRHARRCLNTTLSLLVLVLQMSLWDAQARGSTTGPIGGPLRPDSAARACEFADRAVREWRVGPALDEAVLQPAQGVSVVLQFQGRVIARAERLRGLAGVSPEAPIAELLSEAVGQVLKDGQKSPLVPGDNDAMRPEAMRLMAGEMRVIVELAGARTPMDLGDWGEADVSASAGQDGVLVVATGGASGAPNEPGRTRSAVVFPTTMFLSGLTPARALSGSASSVIGEGGAAAVLEPARTVAQKHGLRFERFNTLMATTLKPGEPATVLHRGATLVPWQRALTVAELRSSAERMVEHLLARPREAGAEDATAEAMDALALARCASVESDTAKRERIVNAIATMLRGRGGGVLGVAEADAGDAVRRGAASVAAALWGIAIAEVFERHIETPAFTSASPKLSELGPVIKRCFDMQTGFVPGVPESGRGVLALAAVRLARVGAVKPELAEALVRRTIADAGASRLVAQWPWVGWAELELAGAGREIPSATVLRQAREIVLEHQLTISQAGVDGQDLIGGVVFTRGGAGLPTWQSLRAIAFLPAMLADTRLTESGEKAKEIVRLMSGVRFVRQLQVDEGSAWMYADARTRLGGVRACTWSRDMPPEATALGLMCMTETLRALTPAGKSGE